MHTPSAALVWELWRRHHPRIIAVVGFVLGFALIYPTLCASAGFNPASQDPLDEIAKMVPEQSRGGPTPLLIFKVLLVLFLACGPWLAMFLTLLCVTWMFTFIELDPKTKALTFPGRLFTLPVSTPFLSWSLMLSGMAAIVVLHACWTSFVRLPHVEMFETYQSCLGWMTLLALAQGIVWALDGWPNTRMYLLAALFFCFLCSAVQRPIFDSPSVLPTLLLLGMVLARVGMQKMRHGQWRGWTAPVPFLTRNARAELKGPKRFASPAQAQLWFEWRRMSRRMCFCAAGFTFVPAAILLGIRFVEGVPLQEDDLTAFAGCLLGVPLFLHFCFAISSPKTDLPFLMNRPLTNGEIMMPKLKSAAITTAISWGFVLVVFCVMPVLGDFRAVLRDTSVPLAGWLVIVLGLIFLTWRFIPVSLGFVLSGNRRLVQLPGGNIVAIYLGGMTLAVMAQDEALWISFCRLLPALLAALVALKFLLAFLAFRISVKRRLLSRSALVGYLWGWFLLVAGLLLLLSVMVTVSPPDQAAILPLALGIVLLVPLARIGFCPIALSWNRHS
jgi:hypothetical protein